MSDRPNEMPMRRREMMALSAGALASVALYACGADGDDAVESAVGGGTTVPDCVLTPEQLEGPFYIDLARVRRDIAEDRPGVPLALAVTVVDANNCEPVRNAAVDVWHCDALGIYSGEPSEGSAGTTFLRGIQLTDGDGLAEFATIYPGQYPGADDPHPPQGPHRRPRLPHRPTVHRRPAGRRGLRPSSLHPKPRRDHPA